MPNFWDIFNNYIAPTALPPQVAGSPAYSIQPGKGLSLQNQNFQKPSGGFFSGTPAYQSGFAQNLSPQVQQFFNQYPQLFQQYDISKMPEYSQMNSSLSRFQQPFNPEQAMQYFEQGVANPALKYYEQVLQPQIKAQGYGPSGTRHTSSLNRAIASSAENLSQGLGSLRANYLQQAQQQHQNNALNAMAQQLNLIQAPGNQFNQFANQYLGTRDVTPIIQGAQGSQFQNIISSLLTALGTLAQTGAFDNFFGGSATNPNPDLGMGA